MEFQEGQSASLTRTVSAADVEAFAALSGDANPVHLDAAYAAETRFGRRIAHGMLAVSYISAVLGTRFPGPGTIYLSQNVSFLKPVYLGDVITATVTVSKYRSEKAILTLLTECYNQHGEKVVDGQAVCLVSDVKRGASPARDAVAATSHAATNGAASAGNAATPAAGSTGAATGNGTATSGTASNGPAANGAPSNGTAPTSDVTG